MGYFPSLHYSTHKKISLLKRFTQLSKYNVPSLDSVETPTVAYGEWRALYTATDHINKAHLVDRERRYVCYQYHNSSNVEMHFQLEFLMNIKPLPNCLSSFYRGQQCSRRTVVQHSFILLLHIIPRSRMDAQWSQHRVEWTRKTQVQAQLLTQRAPLHTEITRGLEHRRIVGEIEGTRTFCEDCQERSFKRRTPLKTS